jgi:CelD/BcsL family acetyltransferase involved in cellulose biosynthesis
MDWDVLLLDGIPTRSGFLPVFRQQAAIKRLPAREQYGPWFHSYLAMEGSWEEYLAGKSHKTRRNMNRSARHLSEQGTITVQRHETPEEIGEGIRAFLEIDRESWKKDEGEIVAGHPILNKYYVDLVNTFSKSNRSEIWILRIGGDPAAGYLCLKQRNPVHAENFLQVQVHFAEILPRECTVDAYHEKLMENALRRHRFLRVAAVRGPLGQ